MTKPGDALLAHIDRYPGIINTVRAVPGRFSFGGALVAVGGIACLAGFVTPGGVTALAGALVLGRAFEVGSARSRRAFRGAVVRLVERLVHGGADPNDLVILTQYKPRLAMERLATVELLFNSVRQTSGVDPTLPPAFYRAAFAGDFITAGRFIDDIRNLPF